MAELDVIIDENVVLHGDGRGKGFALSRRWSAPSASRAVHHRLTRTLSPAPVRDRAKRRAGFSQGDGRIVVAIMIDTAASERILRYCVANPDTA